MGLIGDYLQGRVPSRGRINRLWLIIITVGVRHLPWINTELLVNSVCTRSSADSTQYGSPAAASCRLKGNMSSHERGQPATSNIRLQSLHSYIWGERVLCHTFAAATASRDCRGSRVFTGYREGHEHEYPFCGGCTRLLIER